jgi:competence protein ComEA
VEPSGAPWRVIDSPEPERPPEAQPHRPALPWPAIAVGTAAIAVAVTAVLLGGRTEPSITIDGDGSVPFASLQVPVATASPELVIDVGGAVARPGVYRLPAGSRVGDAIAAAGGYRAGADAEAVDARLNLAAPLRDGDQVRVPRLGESPPPAAAGGAGGESGPVGLIDLNTASAEALDTLPGVGPATVAKIVAAREEQPFGSVDDLLARKVVGSATLEKLRPLVTAGP